MNLLKKKLLIDLLIIIVGIIFSIYISQPSFLNSIGLDLSGFGPITLILFSLFIGTFMTSIFTTIPAVAILISISNFLPIIYIAIFGAMGALIGDLLLFFFIREDLSIDFRTIVPARNIRIIKHLFKLRVFRYTMPFLGGLIIAIPTLPDELGLSLMGLSNTNLKILIPISYTMNFLGILIVLLFI